MYLQKTLTPLPSPFSITVMTVFSRNLIAQQNIHFRYNSYFMYVYEQNKDLINYRKHLEIKALIKGQIENLKMLH